MITPQGVPPDSIFLVMAESPARPRKRRSRFHFATFVSDLYISASITTFLDFLHAFRQFFPLVSNKIRLIALRIAEFARRYGFNVRTLQDWELGRVQPLSTIRVYVIVIDHAPAVVERAWRGAA